MHYGIDWAHKDDKKRACNGKVISATLPTPAPGLIIATENMPTKQMKEYTDAGGRVFRCATHWVKKGCKKLNWNKTDENASKIIWGLYEKCPELFREWKFDPRYSELNSLVVTMIELQKVRVAMSNRAWANPDSKVLEERRDSLQEEENKIKKEITKKMKEFPIWNEFLQHEKGIGPISGARLIAVFGNPNRFKTFAEVCAYFGLHVVDGNAPRRTPGQIANWNQEGRKLLCGVIAGDMVKQLRAVKDENGEKVLDGDGNVIKKATSPWREFYDIEKAKYKTRGDLDPVKDKARIEGRTRRKIAKVFLRKFYRSYKKLENS